jgi:hypothetical protein
MVGWTDPPYRRPALLGHGPTTAMTIVIRRGSDRESGFGVAEREVSEFRT